MPTERIEPTIALSDAAARQWDAVVVGAGPAGSMAARRLALAGHRVLLTDRAAFPRFKVCGCCLNAAALEALDSAGLGGLPDRLGALPLFSLRLACGRAAGELPLPRGVAVSREALDNSLVAEAVRAGAAFLPKALASVPPDAGPCPVVILRQSDGVARVTCRAIVAADGLGGRLLGSEQGFPVRVTRRSRLGCGVILDDGPDDYGPGIIHMACAPGGYVGLVRLEDGRLDVAAAFDPWFVRSHGSPGAAAAAALGSCRLPPVPGLAGAAWRGTPALTRCRPRLQCGPFFVIGDSAAYVEPFTGEGIAWALASAVAVTPLVGGVIERGPPDVTEDAWTLAHRRLFARRHGMCRAIARTLRHPRLAALGIAALSAAPVLAVPFIRAINRTPARPPPAPASIPA